MFFTTRSAITLLAAALATALFAVAADAQQGKGPTGAAQASPPVIVVVQSAVLPEPGGRAVVVRRESGSPREVIVLPANGATAADLAAAISLLAQARERDKGKLAAPQQRISVSSASFAAGQSAEVTRYFENLLARLPRSSTVEIPGIASGPAVIIPQNRAN